MTQDRMAVKIMCIPSEILFADGKWNGLMTQNLDKYYNLIKDNAQFRVRGELETDPNFKQIIPQVILRHEGKYFLHKIIDSNEVRLKSLMPLPLGGHVDDFDLSGDDTDVIQEGLARELREEADVKSKILNKQFAGLIYIEDENPVNEVHVGLMYIYDLDGEDVELREDGMELVGWVDAKYLKDNIENLTYWSRVFVQEWL